MKKCLICPKFIREIMVYKFLIAILSSPYLLHQVWANSTTAALQANTNSTSAAPKEESYFYQEPQGPGTYEFGYHIEDKPTKNIQFRNETSFPNNTVIGSYGFLRADGRFTVVNYVADQNGYRTKKKKVKKDPELSSFTETQTITTTTTTTEISPLNLTSRTLPPLLVDKVMDEFKIDLSPNASPADILHPNISDIIDGKVPLNTDNKNSQPGFDIVQNFIPSNFPIVPFQLPTEIPSKPVDD